ncbi:MAG: D-aminoacyl-tRNA deacylase [Sphaerochaetaceae bacterium]|jgi:D-aminoacyl-tRNA deacylase|nr:D-aminoacyl-tRNA deacylase [Sphaerochaetaceae bacterium]NLY07781.1 D-tyrosyl-tRNA(Tyr) deacylase [Spirochaetales bacterium]
MKAVVQRVRNAKVIVDDKLVSQIDSGLLVYLGVDRTDRLEDIDYLVRKITRLRIFRDENEKMNLDVFEIKGQMLVVSQFTLCAEVSTGNRPSFDAAADPEMANRYYELFSQKVAETGIPVRNGVFGAHMHVVYENDGPVTILYDTSLRKATHCQK